MENKPRYRKQRKVSSNVTFKAMHSYTRERFYDVYELDPYNDPLEGIVQSSSSAEDLVCPVDDRVVHFPFDRNKNENTTRHRFTENAQRQLRTSIAGFQSLIPFQSRNETVDHLPQLFNPKNRTTPNVDKAVGLLLHCIILSLAVMTRQLCRATVFMLRLIADVTLQYIIYRQDIRPLRMTPRVALHCATLCTSLGLRLVLVRDTGGRHDETPPLETPLIESLPSTSQTSVSVCSSEYSRSSSRNYNINSISVMTGIRTPMDFNS